TYAEAGTAVASTKFVQFFAELPAAGWTWAYTQMLINLNHEVAPKASALSCSDCHPAMGGSIATSRMKELYNLSATGCTDPTLCSKR
ncbi:MAG: Cytochrome c bacterial, partial [Pseudomonadota bacterium]